MSTEVIVQTTVELPVKEEATAVYAAAGLTLSDACRITLMRATGDHAPPFDLLRPNQDTVAAMEATRRGEVVKVGGIGELMADLHADD